jgi:hemolysin type calcium-binding protein
MTVATGSGQGNTAVQQIFSLGSSFYLFSNTIDTTFTASSTAGLGSVTVNGSGFAYSSFVSNGTTFYQLVGGTITSVTYTNGANNQSWTGFSVPAATAFQDLLNSTAFGNLFFGGDDTFNWTPANTSIGSTLAGYDGNDTFNLSGYSSINVLDGGNGNDTINLSGGLGAQYSSNYNFDLSSGNSSDFSISNVETVNLAAGSNYTVIAAHDVVATGNTLTIDGSQLGASDRLIFNTNTGGQSFWVVTGNLVLLGGAGNDILEGGTGTNTFDGGGGNNTVDFLYGQQRYGNGSTGVTANLSISGVQNFGTGFGSGSFTNIQNLIGSPIGDTLTGNNGDNVIDGGGGDDSLFGLGGNDTFIMRSYLNASVDGGTGTDTVVLSKSRSSYSLSISGGTVAALDTSGPFGPSTLTLNNVEYVQFSDQTILLPSSGPVVTTAPINAARNHTYTASSLFSVTPVAGVPITQYQFLDTNTDPLSGSFYINGQIVFPSGSPITIAASQLSQVTFVTSQLGDNLQIRAFDGTYWSAPDNVAWAPFSVTVPNTAPVLTTSDITLTHGQTVALSSLFNVSDVDGDTMTRYQLWDSTNDPNSGYFVINNSIEPAWTVIDITASQLQSSGNYFVAGTVGDGLQIRAFDGAAWSAADNVRWAPFTVTVPVNHAPVLTTTDMTVTHGQTIALSSLYSLSDPDGDQISHFQVWDATTDPNSGYFTVYGQRQAAQTVIDLTGSQAGNTFFVTGTIADNIQIRASDGAAWSAADNVRWAPFTISPPANHAPVLTTANKTLSHGQIVAASSLFSVTDADGDAMTRYQLWDSTNNPNSGHFEVSGVAKPAWTVIDITAAQLAQTSFVAGTVGDGIQIRAFDGVSWSAADTVQWAPFTVTVPVDNAPVLTTSNKNMTQGQSVAASSLFSVTDADGDAMTRYQLWDSTNDPNSGYFVVNGVAQAAWTVIDITAAQLAQTSFVAGTVGDGIQIRAFDGAAWSAADTVQWAPFTVTVPVNHAPVLTTADTAIPHNHSVSLSSLVSVSDPDGDPITRYQLWDSTNDPNSGYFIVNGVAQKAWTVIDITAQQAAQTIFLAGTVADNLQIRASDGAAWSAADTVRWAPFTVSVPADNPPVLTTTNTNLTHGQTVALSSLFSVTDADSDAMTRYQLWDSTNDPNSGHFVVSGVAQAAWTVIDITAAQLSQTSFVAGTVGDGIQIRAFDGMAWSAADTARWAPFTVTVPVDNAPVLTTTDMALNHGQTVALSSLFSVTDADGDAMTRYQLWDSTNDPTSGHFAINGVAQAAWTVIDITAAQLSQTSFVAGGVNDNLQIRAYDGAAWSAADTARWAPFAVTVPVNHAPVLTTTDKTITHGQNVALASLFTVTDADGDAMTRYQLWDSTNDPNSGHFVVNGVAQAAWTVIDISAAQAAQTFFVAGNAGVVDGVQIRAFDGVAWSAADNVQWSPFHVTAG